MRTTSNHKCSSTADELLTVQAGKQQRKTGGTGVAGLGGSNSPAVAQWHICPPPAQPGPAEDGQSTMERAGEGGQCCSTATTSPLCPGKSIVCNIAIELKMSICLGLRQLLGLHWFLINGNYVHKSGLTWKPQMLKLSQKLGWLGCLSSAHSPDHQNFVGLKLRAESAAEVSFKMGQQKQPQPCPGKVRAPRAGGQSSLCILQMGSQVVALTKPELSSTVTNKARAGMPHSSLFSAFLLFQMNLTNIICLFISI